MGSWAEERRSRSWRLCEGLGSLPEQGLAALCGAGLAPRVGLVQFGVGLVAPFSDVDKLLALSHANLDIISTSSSSGRPLALCLRRSYGGFWKNLPCFPT